jgi:hypothetical protein
LSNGKPIIRSDGDNRQLDQAREARVLIRLTPAEKRNLVAFMRQL